MTQKHKTLTLCPYCDSNIKSIFYNNENGVLQKLKSKAICIKCERFFNIKVLEITQINAEVKNE